MTLLARMTPEQKVGQLIQADIDSITPDDLRHYPLGSILNGGNSSPHGDKLAAPGEWLALADRFYEASRRPHPGPPGFPALWGADAVHGHNNIPGATIFPHNIGAGRGARPAAHPPHRRDHRARGAGHRSRLGVFPHGRRGARCPLGADLRELLRRIPQLVRAVRRRHGERAAGRARHAAVPGCRARARDAEALSRRRRHRRPGPGRQPRQRERAARRRRGRLRRQRSPPAHRP